MILKWKWILRCFDRYKFKMRKNLSRSLFIAKKKKPKNFIIILLSKWDLRKWPLKWQLRERVCKCDTGQKWDDRILKETFFFPESSSCYTPWQNPNFCQKIQFWRNILWISFFCAKYDMIKRTWFFWQKFWILPQCARWWWPTFGSSPFSWPSSWKNEAFLTFHLPWLWKAYFGRKWDFFEGILTIALLETLQAFDRDGCT